jgi:hypothetical protein
LVARAWAIRLPRRRLSALSLVFAVLMPTRRSSVSLRCWTSASSVACHLVRHLDLAQQRRAGQRLVAEVHRLLGARLPRALVLAQLLELPLHHLLVDDPLLQVELRLLDVVGQVVEHQRDLLARIRHRLDSVVQRARDGLLEPAEKPRFVRHVDPCVAAESTRDVAPRAPTHYRSRP